MEGRSIFVFFIIFNTILGLSGLILLGTGIGLVATIQSEAGIPANKAFISMVVIGACITAIFIIGACSWKRQGVLIAYFVLVILLMISELVIIIFIKVIVKNDTASYSHEVINSGTDIAIIIFAVSLSISFLSFLFSALYFCIMRKENEQKIYVHVQNMENTNMHLYQNL